MQVCARVHAPTHASNRIEEQKAEVFSSCADPLQRWKTHIKNSAQTLYIGVGRYLPTQNVLSMGKDASAINTVNGRCLQSNVCLTETLF
jgi:hypothetical protein